MRFTIVVSKTVHAPLSLSTVTGFDSVAAAAKSVLIFKSFIVTFLVFLHVPEFRQIEILAVFFIVFFQPTVIACDIRYIFLSVLRHLLNMILALLKKKAFPNLIPSSFLSSSSKNFNSSMMVR